MVGEERRGGGKGTSRQRFALYPSVGSGLWPVTEEQET